MSDVDSRIRSWATSAGSAKSTPPKATSAATSAASSPSPNAPGLPHASRPSSDRAPSPASARTLPSPSSAKRAPSPAKAASSSGSAAASLLSVPPTGATPSTGIYALPEAALKIRDLDSGREYALDRRYWIKDMDTGTVYVMEGGETAQKATGADAKGKGSASDVGASASASGGGSAPASARSGAGTSPVGPGKVRELLSGRELSLGEFEDLLGYAQGSSARRPPVQPASPAAPATSRASPGAHGPRSWLGGVLHRMGGSGGAHAGAAEGAAPSAAQPGSRVRVASHRRETCALDGLALTQRVDAHVGVIWAMAFSRSGRYVATAGQDAAVRVWKVQARAGAPGEAERPPWRAAHEAAPVTASDVCPDFARVGSPDWGEGVAEGEEEERRGSGKKKGKDASSGSSDRGGSPAKAGSGLCALLGERPYRTYQGHRADVLDVSWSSTHFLLSASMDKTVRLWHVSMADCLRVFKHTDFVTAIDFHPSDDRLFVSGSIDGKLRAWNIPDQRVASWHDVHDMVTAAAYSPDGRRVVAGTMRGRCRFYAVRGASLEYDAQIDVRNARGAHARGKKVTGVAYAPGHASRLLVTSNDSRVRLYDGLALHVKFKGHANKSTQIKASFSPEGDRVICGSDDGWVYLWSLPRDGAASKPDQEAVREKVLAYDSFQALGDVATVALFAPAGVAGTRPGHVVILAAGYGGEVRVFELPEEGGGLGGVEAS